jgi:hypothetical protein
LLLLEVRTLKAQTYTALPQEQIAQRSGQGGQRRSAQPGEQFDGALREQRYSVEHMPRLAGEPGQAHEAALFKHPQLRLAV